MSKRSMPPKSWWRDFPKPPKGSGKGLGGTFRQIPPPISGNKQGK